MPAFAKATLHLNLRHQYSYVKLGTLSLQWQAQPQHIQKTAPPATVKSGKIGPGRRLLPWDSKLCIPVLFAPRTYQFLSRHGRDFPSSRDEVPPCLGKAQDKGAARLSLGLHAVVMLAGADGNEAVSIGASANLSSQRETQTVPDNAQDKVG